jgi:hypothetical protein
VLTPPLLARLLCAPPVFSGVELYLSTYRLPMFFCLPLVRVRLAVVRAVPEPLVCWHPVLCGHACVAQERTLSSVSFARGETRGGHN